MKIKNIVIIGSIFLIFYAMVGSQLVNFYFWGKKSILSTGEEINNLCNEQGVCPKKLIGWHEERAGLLRKDSMLYFYSTDKDSEVKDDNLGPQTFRIVYEMPLTDNWFEVQGGVGKEITSGWESR